MRGDGRERKVMLVGLPARFNDFVQDVRLTNRCVSTDIERTNWPLARLHFRRFGANDYVVDLVGILTLRELGVLIVSIMVAGRSGSTFTAELGSMKMREEIDALRTMGRDPMEVLVTPRILALVVALPLLALIGSIAALLGGGLVASLQGMAPGLYLSRLREAVSMSDFEVGIIKAPFMALVIGLVACDEGFQGRGSAQSLGARTTSSVVKAIFLVIVLDGLFAMFFLMRQVATAKLEMVGLKAEDGDKTRPNPWMKAYFRDVGCASAPPPATC
jgi:ABC transport permease subunit